MLIKNFKLFTKHIIFYTHIIILYFLQTLSTENNDSSNSINKINVKNKC